MPEPEDQDHPEVVSRNTRYGLVLFSLYLVAYAAYVAVSAFSPATMAAPAMAGINVAVASGFGLIGLALVLAAVYMALSGRGAR
jgi:uncharacterized membrane protein (DUF485 family)